MNLILRSYQREAVGATLDAWAQGMGAPALQLATGLGKTVIFAELCRVLVRAMNSRPLILVHRDELVTQTCAKLAAADPALRVGIIQRDSMGVARTDVVVASVQTLIRRLDKLAPERFTHVIVDECHHAAAASYLEILAHFPGPKLGVTATMARGDRRGLGHVWDDVVFERTIPWGVEHGFLVPAEVRTIAVPGLDTDAVKRSAGDLQASDLGKAMATAHAGEHVANAYSRFGRDDLGRLRRAISFAPVIDTAEAWAADYERIGARVAVITGSTPANERRAAYRDVGAGRKDVLSSVMVLTEGFDLPAVEVAIIGRPTKSMPLLTQMVGRVLRPSPSTGKEAALLLDVVGALGRGLARSFDLSIPGPDKPVAPEDPDYVPEPRERIELAPPAAVDWVALDLHGQPIKARNRKVRHAPPEWLRTYGGVPFLPRTKDQEEIMFCHVFEDSPTAWWRKRRDAGPEPLVLADGADVRDLHAGVAEALDAADATDAQLELLARLRGPQGILWSPGGADRPSRRRAYDLIEIHFASQELDRICRPRMLQPVAPPPGVS